MVIAAVRYCLFQFQPGSIKRRRLWAEEWADFTAFQFQPGSIKRRAPPSPTRSRRPCFNSSLVLLKVDARVEHARVPRFNSSLVLLKAGPGRRPGGSGRPRFQFQPGSIKRRYPAGPPRRQPFWFQFQPGSIKSGSGPSAWVRLPWFQFQPGSIKRCELPAVPALDDLFQFQPGSIKRGREVRQTRRHGTWVSIPAWFY